MNWIELLVELQDELRKLPYHCRAHALRYAIHNVELLLQRWEHFNDCLQCLDDCSHCEKLKEVNNE